MLIVNNGVPKSGSTWVQKIIVEAMAPRFPGPRWRNGWSNPSVDLPQLGPYVKSGEWRGAPTLIKMHFAYSPGKSFLFQEGIRIVVSHRNLPDSVVSRFHHEARSGRASADRSEDWFRTEGRAFAELAVRIRTSWMAVEQPVHFVAYERMVEDAPAEICRLLTFLGQPADRGRCERLAQATQARMQPPGALRDGQHVRTGGRSVAHLELPADLYEEFARMDRDILSAHPHGAPAGGL